MVQNRSTRSNICRVPTEGSTSDIYGAVGLLDVWLVCFAS